jgi:peptide/nickel transport system permease protein
LLIGGLSGLVGGTTDLVIQRIIEILASIPQIPFWMALSATVPASWSPVQTYFAITIVLSLLSWTRVARVVRGKFLALREADFVMAAYAMGAGNWWVIIRHLIPNFLSYVLVTVTLTIPGMILGETSLSFLGIGLKPPAISWGILLQQAQNMRTIALRPWLLLPGVFVVIAVLAFNFVGDGLRDAADPYTSNRF